MKFAVTGWYGHGNIGDELLMCAVSKSLRERVAGAEVTVLSHNPALARATTGCPSTLPLLPYGSLRSARGLLSQTLHSLRAGREWRRMLEGLDVLVVGGGSLLNDRQPRNLPMWQRMVEFYKRRGAKVFFYGISVGPIRDRNSLPLIRDILLMADGNTFRDCPSLELMMGLLPESRLVQAADPVLSLIQPQAKVVENWPPKPMRIGFNVRRISSVPDEECDAVGLAIARALLENFDAQVWFVPMSAGDSAIIARIRQGLPEGLRVRFHAHAYAVEKMEEHLALYRQFDLFVTMRLHTSVLASLHNVPVLGLDCNKKIPGFLREIGLGDFIVEVSDGVHGCTANEDQVVARTQRLINCWPSIQQCALDRIRELARRESLNVAALQQALTGR